MRLLVLIASCITLAVGLVACLGAGVQSDAYRIGPLRSDQGIAILGVRLANDGNGQGLTIRRVANDELIPYVDARGYFWLRLPAGEYEFFYIRSRIDDRVSERPYRFRVQADHVAYVGTIVDGLDTSLKADDRVLLTKWYGHNTYKYAVAGPALNKPKDRLDPLWLVDESSAAKTAFRSAHPGYADVPIETSLMN